MFQLRFLSFSLIIFLFNNIGYMSKFYVCISNLLEPYKSKPIKESLRKKLVKLLTSRQQRKLDWNKNERLVWVTRFARTSEMLQSCGRGQKIINILPSSPSVPPCLLPWHPSSVLRAPSRPPRLTDCHHNIHFISSPSQFPRNPHNSLHWHGLKGIWLKACLIAILPKRKIRFFFN